MSFPSSVLVLYLLLRNDDGVIVVVRGAVSADGQPSLRCLLTLYNYIDDVIC